MIFYDLEPKDLERYLILAKRRKAQIAAEYNAALNKYLTAAGGNTTVELKQELHQKADALKAQLDKVTDGIAKIERRLGGFALPIIQSDTFDG